MFNLGKFPNFTWHSALNGCSALTSLFQNLTKTVEGTVEDVIEYAKYKDFGKAYFCQIVSTMPITKN